MSSPYPVRHRLLSPLALGLTLLLAAPVALAQSVSDATEDSSEQVGYLLADKVFTEPSTASAEVTAVTRDDLVRVLPSEKNGWYEVYRAAGGDRVGYAFRPYVSRFGSGGPTAYSPDERPKDDPRDAPLFEVVFADVPAGTGVPHTVHTWANVRSGPGMDHPAFGVIRPDTPFQVAGLERGWGKVYLAGEPSVGYVSASLLHRLPAPTPVVTDPVVTDPMVTDPVAAEPATPTEPIREAVVGGQAGGGVPATAEPETTQEEALREALSGSGVDAETLVYVTRTGRKFHREGCRHLRSRTFAIPLAEAMMDYSPCRTCKPLQPSDAPEE